MISLYFHHQTTIFWVRNPIRIPRWQQVLRLHPRLAIVACARASEWRRALALYAATTGGATALAAAMSGAQRTVTWDGGVTAGVVVNLVV